MSNVIYLVLQVVSQTILSSFKVFSNTYFSSFTTCSDPAYSDKTHHMEMPVSLVMHLATQYGNIGRQETSQCSKCSPGPHPAISGYEIVWSSFLLPLIADISVLLLSSINFHVFASFVNCQFAKGDDFFKCAVLLWTHFALPPTRDPFLCG